jgi:hypothetical protein
MTVRLSSLTLPLPHLLLELADDIKQRYIHKAAQVNEQRARARASRLKRKKETIVHKTEEVPKMHLVEMTGEGTLDPEAYKQLQHTVSVGVTLAKMARIAPLTGVERLEVTSLDGTPCVVHQDLIFRTSAPFGPKLL